MVFTNGYFTWNSVNLSTHVREVRMTPRITTVPDHDTMGSTGEKFAKVLQGYDLEVIFRQDYGAAAVDVTLGVDHLAGTARTWAVRPDAGAISATNPEYQGTGLLTEYGAVTGAFGEVLGSRCTIVPSVAGLTRDIVP